MNCTQSIVNFALFSVHNDITNNSLMKLIAPVAKYITTARIKRGEFNRQFDSTTSLYN